MNLVEKKYDKKGPIKWARPKIFFEGILNYETRLSNSNFGTTQNCALGGSMGGLPGPRTIYLVIWILHDWYCRINM